MDKEQSLSEYVNELKVGLEEAYPDSFFFSGANDLPTLREWYALNVSLGFVLLALNEEKLPRRFSLKDIDSLIKKKFRNYARSEAKDALGTLNEENIPYIKLDKLYKILKSILLEVGVKDLSILEILKELRKLEDVMQIERELINFEVTFYKFLFRKSKLADKCKERAEKELFPYKIYWNEGILRLTRSSLIKKCLKDAYGIPDFTIL